MSSCEDEMYHGTEIVAKWGGGSCLEDDWRLLSFSVLA
jgi:hypothetical protein